MSAAEPELYLATVSVVYAARDGVDLRTASGALLEREEVVTVRIGRSEDEPTVFRADVAGPTPEERRAGAARIATEVAARMGVAHRVVDVELAGPSTRAPSVDALGGSTPEP